MLKTSYRHSLLLLLLQPSLRITDAAWPVSASSAIYCSGAHGQRTLLSQRAIPVSRIDRHVSQNERHTNAYWRNLFPLRSKVMFSRLSLSLCLYLPLSDGRIAQKFKAISYRPYNFQKKTKPWNENSNQMSVHLRSQIKVKIYKKKLLSVSVTRFICVPQAAPPCAGASHGRSRHVAGVGALGSTGSAFRLSPIILSYSFEPRELKAPHTHTAHTCTLLTSFLVSNYAFLLGKDRIIHPLKATHIHVHIILCRASGLPRAGCQR